MTSVVKPITPGQVAKKRVETLPGFVIEAFNQLIAESCDSNCRSATILQEDAVRRIQQLGRNGEYAPSSNEIFDNHWLDVESIFEEAGWKVSYDKPGYNESYEANWTFKAK